MSLNRNRIFFIILIALACFLRFFKLEKYPLAINQDELSNIYDGYSIGETLADRSGAKLPLAARGFGEIDFRPPLYAYLSSIPIKIFGFSVFSGRLIGAMAGLGSLILLYLFAKKLVNEKFALLSLLLGAISPWHILFSRMAHEGAMLPPFFIILILYLWYLASQNGYKQKYVIYLSFALGLSVNAYQSMKLIAILLTILIIADIFLRSTEKLKSIGFVLVFCLLGALPQIILFAHDPVHFLSRAKSVSIHYQTKGELVSIILHNFLSNIEPNYLFFKTTYLGNSHLSTEAANNLSVARLLTFEAVFFYVGVFHLKKVVSASFLLPLRNLYWMCFFIILTSAITTDNPHALRTSGILIITPLFSAAGILYFEGWLKEKFANTKIRVEVFFISLAVALLLVNGFTVIKSYTKSIALRNTGQQHFLVEITKKLGKYRKQYQKVWFEDVGNQPYIYVAAFSGITPKEFQTNPKAFEAFPNGWDKFSQLDNVYFKSYNELVEISSNNKTNEKELFITTQKINNNIILDVVNWNNEAAYFSTKP